MRMKPTCVDLAAETYEEWRALLEEKLKTAKWATIHIYANDKYLIDFPKCYEYLVKLRIEDKRVARLEVTDELKSFLLDQEKPKFSGEKNKFTPFETIELDNGFCSLQYGNDLYQRNEKLCKATKIFGIITLISVLISLPFWGITMLADSAFIGHIKMNEFLASISFPFNTRDSMYISYIMSIPIFVEIFLLLLSYKRK